MRTAWMLCSLGILGCGGAAPGSAPKPAPTVAVSAGEPLVAMEPETDAERTAREANKVAECNAMIAVINDCVNEITAVSDAPQVSTTGVEEFEAMVAAMEKARGRLAKLDLHDQRLRGFSQDYQKMARAVAKAARALIVAHETTNAAAAKKASDDVANVVKDEDPLVDGINKYCHATP